MAISGYLLSASGDQIRAFNKAVMDKAGLHFGLVLTPTSSTRAYIPANVLKQVTAALGENEFQKLLEKTRVVLFQQVDEADAKSLIETRDPEDIADRPDLEQDPLPDPATGKMLDWHLVETGLCTAWQTLGGPDKIQWGDIKVGHIDTGFTTHPALGFRNNELNSPWVDTNRDRNLFERELHPSEGLISFAMQDSALDTLAGFSGGHGTRTMSVLSAFNESAAARNGNSYAGYYGAAPKVPVIPVRIEDTIWLQNAIPEDLPAAIDYLVEQAGVSVISLSMGSPKSPVFTPNVPQKLRTAIDNAYEKGVIFCCAAGNHVPDERVTYPARCPRMIAVGGSAPGLFPWGGSSYGVQVDISAPAFPIRRPTTLRGNKYQYGIGDGTSFATPQVAGTAAMWLVHRRVEIPQKYPEMWQRVAAFREIVRSTATAGNDWDSTVRGTGILNAAGVLGSPLPDRGTLTKDTALYE